MRQTSLACALALLAATLTACATAPSPSPGGRAEVGRTGHVSIVLAQAGDDEASLAQRYLGSAALAWRVTPLSRPLRAGGAAAVALTDADAALAAPVSYVPILCYHRFTLGRSTSRMQVSAADFQAQLAWLRSDGWTVVPLSAVVDFVGGRRRLPPKAVAITVDDGYRSIDEVALPILKRFNDPATAFIYTDFVGSRDGLSWADVDDLTKSGLVDVQSHSKSHADLVKLGSGASASAYAAKLRVEIETPRDLLRRHGGGPPVAFAYPYGATDAAVTQAVRRAGYAAAVTVSRGGDPSWAPPYLLRRDMVFGDEALAVFQRRVHAAAGGETGPAEAEGEIVK